MKVHTPIEIQNVIKAANNLRYWKLQRSDSAMFLPPKLTGTFRDVGIRNRPPPKPRSEYLPVAEQALRDALTVMNAMPEIWMERRKYAAEYAQKAFETVPLP